MHDGRETAGQDERNEGAATRPEPVSAPTPASPEPAIRRALCRHGINDLLPLDHYERVVRALNDAADEQARALGVKPDPRTDR